MSKHIFWESEGIVTSSMGGSEVKVTFGVMVGVRQVVVLVYINAIDLTFMCPKFEISV